MSKPLAEQFTITCGWLRTANDPTGTEVWIAKNYDEIVRALEWYESVEGDKEAQDLYDQQRNRIAALEARNKALEAVVKAQDDLLACYRLGRQPSERTLNTIAKFKEARDAK